MANPFVLGNNDVNTQTVNAPLEEFKEYAWDFTKNCFMYNDDGTHKIVTRNDAIKVWVYKVLMTERYRYGAYYDDYGIELEKFVGKVPNNSNYANELYAYVKEALLVNTYITAINDVSIVQKGKKITLNISLTTIYGKSTFGVEV